MVQVEENLVLAHTCPACHGTWISIAALQRRARIETDPHRRHIPFPSLPELAATVTHDNSTQSLPCLLCKQAMRKSRFLPKIPVQIDRCDRCGYIWLDPGEQGLLLRLYAELLASAPHLAPQGRPRLDALRNIRSLVPDGARAELANVAWNVGSFLFSILLDFLLSTLLNSNTTSW
jgi:Zn-finger nucleic acid-binding protein